MDKPALDEPTAILRLRKLFPTGTSIAWSASPRAVEELLPTETGATEGMAAARRQAYAQGRWCAHRALAQLGLPDAAVQTGEQRAPLWPPGITGSIAHCAGRAIAVAARLEVAGSVGVDMEETGDLEAGVLELICTPAEHEWLEHARDATLARSLFAIKESIYKCLWSRVRRFIEFQEVEIDLDLSRQSYRARATGPGLDASTVAAIQGAYLQIDELLFASAYLPSPSGL